MTLDEMRHQLQMSKPSMSAGVKKLQEFDIVKQQFDERKPQTTFYRRERLFHLFPKLFTKKISA